MPERQKSRGGFGSAYKPLSINTRDKEPLKSIIANGIWDILGWHIWGVISVSISIVLISLNLAQVAMDAEIGRNSAETANIIAGLQLLIQMHGLSVTASLFQIARQWIHSNLLSLDRGIPLALVGAERELGLPSFVISPGYLAAVKYSTSLWWGPQTLEEVRTKWNVGMLTTFLFVSCIVSVLAGPASGALMIPRVHWFLDSTFDSPFPFNGSEIYPYLIVPPEVGQSNDSITELLRNADPLREYPLRVELDYWGQLYPGSLISALPSTTETHTRHQVSTSRGITYVNTTTTWGRSMDHDPGVGSTYAKAIMKRDPERASSTLVGARNHIKATVEADHETAMRRWSQRLYVMIDATAMVAQVNCRYQPKIPCPPSMDPTIAPWCLEGSATPNRSLILLSQLTSYVITGRSKAPDGSAVVVSRTYITEGLKSKTHPQFVDSLQVVFDTTILRIIETSDFRNHTAGMNIAFPNTNVTVCSISTVMTPAVVSALTVRMDGRNVDCAYRVNQTLHYNERWLDYTGALDTNEYPAEIIYGSTPAPRSMVELVTNPVLRNFGKAVDIMSARIGMESEGDPAWLEITVAGAFISLFSTFGRSTSQYSVGPTIELPESAMPEPRVHYPGDKRLIINVYNQGYGFMLSSRVGILAVVLLILHGVIVLVGSVWQLFWQRSVINGWSTVPEYLALGLGSTLQDGVLGNTCAGITAAESLRTIVKVGTTTREHLELQVGRTGLQPVLGRLDAKYGARAKSRHRGRNGVKKLPSTEFM